MKASALARLAHTAVNAAIHSRRAALPPAPHAPPSRVLARVLVAPLILACLASLALEPLSAALRVACLDSPVSVLELLSVALTFVCMTSLVAALVPHPQARAMRAGPPAPHPPTLASPAFCRTCTLRVIVGLARTRALVSARSALPLLLPCQDGASVKGRLFAWTAPSLVGAALFPLCQIAFSMRYLAHLGSGFPTCQCCTPLLGSPVPP